MKKIGNVSPYVFENTLIIALSIDWISEFSKIPDFDVVIDDKKRLQIISREIIKGGNSD